MADSDEVEDAEKKELDFAETIFHIFEDPASLTNKPLWLIAMTIHHTM